MRPPTLGLGAALAVGLEEPRVEQDVRPHLRVERAGGPRWLFFPWLWRIVCDSRGTSPLGQERGAEHGRAFPMRCRGGLGMRALVPGHGSVSCSVTPSSQRLVWATSSQAGSQAPVRSWEPRSQGRAGQGREARGRQGPLPAPATPARAKSGSGQPLPPGGRGRGEAPRRAGWQLRASSPSGLCATPGSGQMRGLKAKEEMKRQRHCLVRGPVWVGGGHPSRHSKTSTEHLPCACPEPLLASADAYGITK